MSLTFSTAAKNVAGDSIVGLISAGSVVARGYIEIRDGAQPSSPEAPATGKILAKLEFSNPAFKKFSNGVAQANAVFNDMQIDNTGVATWFRIYNRNNVPILDGSITGLKGGGDIELDNVNLIKDGVVSIASLYATIS